MLIFFGLLLLQKLIERDAPHDYYTTDDKQQTDHGPLIEIPVSVTGSGRGMVAPPTLPLFGGGYLRLSPLLLIKWGVKNLSQKQRPLIIYIHPRELDPDHPRLPLPWLRRFKSYVNLKSAMPKLDWLCSSGNFVTMHSIAESAESPQEASGRL